MKEIVFKRKKLELNEQEVKWMVYSINHDLCECETNDKKQFLKNLLNKLI